MATSTIRKAMSPLDRLGPVEKKKGERKANAGHLSLGRLKAMAAIEACRTAELGGHVAACEDCGRTVIGYNSCGNRHSPKCQGAAAGAWLAEREADLLPPSPGSIHRDPLSVAKKDHAVFDCQPWRRNHEALFAEYSG